MAEAPSLNPREAAPSREKVLTQARHNLSPTLSVSPAQLRALHAVISSGCTIKSQQRGEADLTTEQKLEILSDVFHRTPGAFLRRFGSVLDEDGLKLFESERDYEVQFYLKELRKKLEDTKYETNQIKNRRFEYLKELMDSSSYFSDEEMRERNPLLFEQYVGQYLTEDEKFRLERNLDDMSLSSLIMKNMDIDDREKRLKKQRDSEDAQLEERDSSSDEDNDITTEHRQKAMAEPQPTTTTTEVMKLSSNPDTAARERTMLKQEFLRAMQLSFMSGQDEGFDYSLVDGDETYDSLDMRQQDEEDAYFDEEEPEWCGGQEGRSGGDDGMETSKSEQTC